VEAVAVLAGFGTAETMRRTFLRVLRTNPSDYRSRFRAA
jgi:transcriptional regulator GlxA family with amidase domain